MEFVGVKELAQNLRKYIQGKDGVIVTVHGKPKKILKDLSPKEVTELFRGQGVTVTLPPAPLRELKAYGMWKENRPMRNSVSWVNRLRRQEGLRYFRETR